ncbi:hypothetical protein ACN47E_004465 [Coniothyrium glycines]
MTGNLFPARLRESHQDKHQNTKFRRNGKLQACEPCRKGKLRCDHMMPTCGRCARRSKAEQCVYHPAPLTKATSIPTPPSTNSEQGSPIISSRFTPAQQTAFVYPTIHDTATSSSSLLRQVELQQPLPSLVDLLQYNAAPVRETSTSLKEASSGRGARLSRANSVPVLVDTQNQGSGVADQEPPPDHQHFRDDALMFDTRAAFINDNAVLAEHEPSIGIQPVLSTRLPKLSVTQTHIEKGATMLTLFTNFPAVQKYVDKWFSYGGGFIVIAPMMKIYTSGIWSAWQKTLEGRRPAGLRQMSEQIWDSTLKPVSRLFDRHTTPREFYTSVTGENLRWEVVGMITALVSLLAQTLKDGDPIFCNGDEAPVDRAALALQMHQASEMCVSFCDEFGILNDLYLSLLYENTISYYNLCTRASYENSRKMAALAAALLCCNLHQECKADADTPFFLVEFRKRLFTSSYAADKRCAISSGTPPKLTRQYCRIQLPLDLTETQIMSEGTDLEAAVGALDDEGWNSSAVIRQSTFARFSAANALITEEILEISLGHLPQDEIIRRAAEIEAKTDRCWAELPAFLRVGDSLDFLHPNKSPFEHLVLACIRFANLEHHFLLQRTLSKKVGCGTNEPNINLLSICEKLFQFVLFIVENRDFFRDFQVDFVSMLAVHGVPSAAILAVELLHQERNPTAASAMTYPLHRSETIQKLSVFVSCLSSVRTEINGSRSCERGRRFLKKILDMILGAGPLSTMHSPSNMVTDEFSDPTLGAPLLQPGSDGDFVKWLESMEWDQDVWVNFN